VLSAGGFRSEGTAEIPITSAEIYDPRSGQFTLTADMNEARSGHTATMLPDGQVLIVGGWTEGGRSSTAELYDPASGSFRMAASMSAPRASMTATLLKEGTVLIAGGDSARDTPQLVAEIYDPAANTFTQTGSLNQGRSAHAAATLKDGRVLLSGGHSDYSTVQASAEVYDPTTGEFTQTGSLNIVRRKHAAVSLQDGRVLVVGGSSQDDWHNQYDSAEIFDPGTGTFAPTADLNAERFKLVDAAVLLNDGSVLVAGGSRQVELFDAQTATFIVVGQLDDPYYFSAVTLLQDGRALISGGYDPDIQPSDRAWIYTPN
jgi:WD40 repeat protein